jgi:spoIIIJ-associated protein
MKKKDLTIIKKTSEELLKKLGFPEAGITVDLDEEDRIQLQIEVSKEDSGLLIGYHGETIYSLQTIISYIIAKKLGEWTPILVNIGDYREKRQEALKNMALNASQRVKEQNQPITLPQLNSSERRIIHMVLADDSEVETFSEGEGRQRRLTIEPAKRKEKSDKIKMKDE